MKKLYKISLFAICYLLFNTAYTQNLVPNSSFEDTTSCPWIFDLISNAVGWFKPTPGTSDLLHECSFQVPNNILGEQNANMGKAYAGLYTYDTFFPDSSYREYISIQLTDTLEQGERYNVDFYVSRSDSSNYATIFGAYFSNNVVISSSINNLNLTPQVEETNSIISKSLWTKLSYEYTAIGGEQYITLGNFRDNSSSDTLNTYDGGDPNNTNFQAAYYYVDDISVVKDTTTGISEIDYSINTSIYPNPNKGILNIELDSELKQKRISYKLINIISQEILEPNIISETQIDLRDFSNGIYLLRIEIENQTFTKKIILYK